MKYDERIKVIADIRDHTSNAVLMSLTQYLQGKADEKLSVLEMATDTTEIYRSQGAVSVLREIIKDLGVNNGRG